MFNISTSANQPLALLAKAIIIAFTAAIVMAIVLSSLLRFNDLTVAFVAGILGKFVAYRYMKSRYAIKIFSMPSISFFFKFVIPASFLSVLLAGFPWSIWLARSISVPKEYLLLSEANIIERIIFLLCLCVVGPLMEEIFFRGYLYHLLKTNFNLWLSVLFTVVLFNFFHGMNSFFSWQLGLLSLISIYLFERSGNIMNSILLHIIHNTARIMLVYLGMHYRGVS